MRCKPGIHNIQPENEERRPEKSSAGKDTIAELIGTSGS